MDPKSNMYPEVSQGGNYGPPPPQPQYGQGMQSSTTTVVIQQPQIQTNKLLVADVFGNRNWSTGIFDCFSNVANCKILIKNEICLRTIFFL